MHALDVICVYTIQRHDDAHIAVIVLIEPRVQRQRKLHDADISAAASDDDIVISCQLLLKQLLKIRRKERVRAVLADQLMDIWLQLIDDLIFS